VLDRRVALGQRDVGIINVMHAPDRANRYWLAALGEGVEIVDQARAGRGDGIAHLAHHRRTLE